MRTRNILILVVVVLLIAVVAVGYLLIQSSGNDTSNDTNDTITVSDGDNNVGTSDSQNDGSQQDQSSQSDIISASKAQAIASNYLSSSSQYSHFGAGSPTLKGDVYYVPMVVTSDDAQSAKGTVVGYVKVDAATGEVLGVEVQDITTGQTINEPP
jgi:predicted PurR-regulated permease PerM